MKFDSFQLSPGGQIAFAGVPKQPQTSLALTLQTVFKRGEDDGRLEIASGVQVGAPIFVKGSDGIPVVVSWFANFTWVDPLGKAGLFHLWSPFATVGGQTDFQGRETSLGAGLFPINLTIDSPFTDKLNLTLNSGVVGTIGLKTQEFQWGVQTAVGVSGTFTLF